MADRYGAASGHPHANAPRPMPTARDFPKRALAHCLAAHSQRLTKASQRANSYSRTYQVKSGGHMDKKDYYISVTIISDYEIFNGILCIIIHCKQFFFSR